MRTPLPALLLFAVSMGCEQEDGETPKGAPPEVIARCGELASAIEAMLGPKFDKPVPVRLVDKNFIDGFARETVARTVPKETERRIERLAVRLKQIPPDCSMLDTQIRLLQLFASGFYDPHLLECGDRNVCPWTVQERVLDGVDPVGPKRDGLL